MCERRSVRICCHESPHAEAASPRLRPFHTASPKPYEKSGEGPNHYPTKRRKRLDGAPYFGVSHCRGTSIKGPPTTFHTVSPGTWVNRKQDEETGCRPDQVLRVSAHF